MNEAAKLLMPFAPRWLGHPDPLGKENNVRTLPHFVLGLSRKASLWQFFPVPLEGNFIYNLAVHWDYFIDHPPKHVSPKQSRLIGRQSVWPLNGALQLEPHRSQKLTRGMLKNLTHLLPGRGGLC